MSEQVFKCLSVVFFKMQFNYIIKDKMEEICKINKCNSLLINSKSHSCGVVTKVTFAAGAIPGFYGRFKAADVRAGFDACW